MTVPRAGEALLALVPGAILVLAFLVDVATGPASLDLPTVVAALFGRAGEGPASIIVRDFRLPIALMAVVVGAALGLAGAAMQTVLDNPLASPFTMGLAACAGVGASAAVLGLAPTGEPLVDLPLLAFVGAVAGALVIDAVGRWRGMTRDVMVLAGIALMFLAQAVQALQQFSASPEALARIVHWLFGDLQKIAWGHVGCVAIGVALLAPLLFADAWRLTALKLGDERAAAIGVNVVALKRRALAIVAGLTAVAVCFVGTIGFIGLVAPHLARALVGEDHRFLLPVSALTGAALLSVANVVSKSIVPGTVVPVTVVTALVGVPFLFYLIWRSGRAA